MIFRWASALLFLLLTVPGYGQKPGKAMPGRIHLLNGTSQQGQVVFVDYNKIKLLNNGTEAVYTPLEVGSFVMAADSFVVLRDFEVAIGEDDQEYRIAFVKVGAVGPGFALYYFLGTMRREDTGFHMVSTGPVGSGRMGTMSNGESTTVYRMSKTWFLKVDSDPQWHSLPQTGTRLRQLVGPVIADDQKLAKSVNWEYVDGRDLQKILLQYLANKKAAGK